MAALLYLALSVLKVSNTAHGHCPSALCHVTNNVLLRPDVTLDMRAITKVQSLLHARSQASPLGSAAQLAASAGASVPLSGLPPLPGAGFGALEGILPSLGAIAPSIPLLPQLSANLSVILPTASEAVTGAAAQTNLSATAFGAAAPAYMQSLVASAGATPSGGGTPLLSGLAGVALPVLMRRRATLIIEPVP